jgi:hypothetical protein
MNIEAKIAAHFNASTVAFEDGGFATFLADGRACNGWTFRVDGKAFDVWTDGVTGDVLKALPV